MLKINALTKEQEAELPEYCDKWLAIGLSTKPLDFGKAKEAVGLIYKTAGLQPPKTYFQVFSPLGGAILGAMLRGGQVRGQVWDKVRDQLRNQVWDQVRDQVRDQVWDQVGDQVRGQVGDQVWNKVRDKVRGQVGDKVRDQLWDQLGDQVGDQLWDQVWGSHDAPWLAFYDFFKNECNLEICRKLTGLTELAKHCGWWAPYQNAVILQDRHSTLNRDGIGRLHCEDGLACGYPDGWGVYAWHGVRVPERIILKPDSITVQEIQKEENTEIRRVMLERYGEKRYLEDSGAKIIHSSGNNVLYKQEIPDDEPLVMVRVLNSTPEPDGSLNTYFLRVPPQIADADAAVAWTFGMDKQEYQPKIET